MILVLHRSWLISVLKFIKLKYNWLFQKIQKRRDVNLLFVRYPHLDQLGSPWRCQLRCTLHAVRRGSSCVNTFRRLLTARTTLYYKTLYIGNQRVGCNLFGCSRTSAPGWDWKVVYCLLIFFCFNFSLESFEK